MILLWKLALNNLFRNRRRTLATLFTVCFGYVGLLLLAGFINYTEQSIRALTVYVNHGGHISIYKKGGLDGFFAKPAKFQIDPKLLSDVQNILHEFPEEIENVGTYLSGMGLLSNGQRSTPVLIRGIDPEIETYVKNHSIVREFLPELGIKDRSLDFAFFAKQNPDTISITDGLSELLGRAPPFDQLSEKERDLQLAAKAFTGDFNAVNAFLGPRHSTGMPYLEDISVIASLKSLQILLATDGVSSMSIYLKDVFGTHAFLRTLKKRFAEAQLPVDIYSFTDEDVGALYAGTMSFTYSMGFFYFILILGAVMLSIVNTITIGIIERTKEIGTLRAIGYLPGQLSLLLVRENFIISTFCVILGFVLAQIIAFIVNSAGFRFRPPGIADDIRFQLLPVWWLGLIIAIPMIVIASLTAYWVTSRKAKEPMIQLLTEPGGSS